MSVKRICLWSSPRNISTATMYSFAQRSDTTVIDEPLYAHYLLQSGIQHPGRQETLKSMENDGQKVVEEVILGPCATSILFMKHMTHHLVNIDTSFMDKTDNVLLIRHPYEIIRSYSKVIAHPEMADVGVKQQYELYLELEKKGKLAAVVDTNEVLKNPRKIWEQLCLKLGIPFDEQMLSWPAGARPEDGVWAKYWYHNVHNSTGFQPYNPKERVTLAPHLEALVAECVPFYEFLFQYSLKA